MPTDPKPHQLTKQISGSDTRATFDSGVYVNSTSTATNGWVNIDFELSAGVNIPGILHRTYIDLAGWSNQELTAFFKGIQIQRSFIPLGISNCPLIFEYDFVTTRKLSKAEVSGFISEPGFLPSTLDMMELIYSEKRTFAQNSTIPGAFIKIDQQTAGTGDATAMDKLHWTRVIVYFVGVTTANMVNSPANLVVSAVTAKEKDLVWMERLRRSYVLQDRADV